jgi:ABC-type sugar transport system ATPase subunit
MIHQEISLIPTIDVAENIWIGREKTFCVHGFINTGKRYRATEDLLERLGIHISPKTRAGRLSIANMQLVELARAVSYNSEIVIMDEPTSSFADSEVELLYSIIRDLSANGTSIIFISHKLEEIYEVCEHITVMRDGKYVSDHPIGSIQKSQLIAEIAGREISELYPKEKTEIGDVMLKVSSLCSAGVFQDISFEVRSGEILGFCGLVGAGRTEIMRAIFGIDKFDSGEVYLKGEKLRIKSPEDAIRYGLAMVTEDRLRMGIISNLSILMNVSLAYLREIARMGLINQIRERSDAQTMIEKMNIKTPNLKQYIGALSGGNQQKVILARWLQTKPKVLIMDEPTRGIDVGSKSEIHRLIGLLAKEGVAVIMISSEMPEILGISDRIIVIREGRITADVLRSEVSQEKLLQYAFGASHFE